MSEDALPVQGRLGKRKLFFKILATQTFSPTNKKGKGRDPRTDPRDNGT